MPFAEPRAIRHDLVGAASGRGLGGIASCCERGSRERLLGERGRPRCQRAQASSCSLGAGAKRKPLRPRPPRGDTRQQLTDAHGRHPLPERRPSIQVEARLPGANPLARMSDGQPHQPEQAKRQTNGGGRVVASSAKPTGQDRRDSAAALALVPTNEHGDHLWLAARARRAADLSRAYPMPVQPDARTQRPARRAAATAAPRPNLLCGRQILRPILDRDRRVDDALTARSSLHECRARREALTANLRLPSPFCGRHCVDARSMARASTSTTVRGPSPRPCREMPFAPPPPPSNCSRDLLPDHVNRDAQ